MKKHFIFATALVFSLLLTACGGSPAEEEEVKMMPSSSVTLTGNHSELLTVTDSVKLVLCANESKTRWKVQAIIPIANTTPWKNVPGTNEKNAKYFLPKMGNASARFLDQNESEVKDGSLAETMAWSTIESVLGSNSQKNAKMTICAGLKNKVFVESDYKTAKQAFDKIAGIELYRLDLSEAHNASSSSSSSSSRSSKSSKSSYDDDDFEEALRQYERAVDAAEKALDMIDEYDF